jgi:hypothetical protein
MLTQHAIRMVHRDLLPGGDKNGADINLALDALEMAFTHSHINAFVIVGGDSDFISLVEKLKQYDKKVFIVGGRQFTSGILQRNCHEFIAYENLVGASGTPAAPSGRRDTGRGVRVDRAPIEQAIPLVTRALKVLSEREVSPQLGLLKSTLLQLDSTFSERTYGAGSFRDFAQKLERSGVLKVHQAKGGWIVGPANGAAAAAESGGATDDAPVPEPAPPRQETHQRQTAAAAVTGTAAEGVAELKRILTSAQIRRWPMYLRNVKQIIRQVSASFDERAYGFASLVDVLRAAQKEGIVRVDRDRTGVVRIFQGPQFAAATYVEPAAPLDEAAETPIEVEPVVAPPPDVVIETTAEEVEPAATATAEAAEPASPRRRRSRAGSSRTPRARSRVRQA